MSELSIRQLSPSLAKIAKTELNENQKQIQNDLDAFKIWLSQNSYLLSRIDDQFLISFLRGCKYSLERAKEKLETYYLLRSECPEFFGNRDPTDEKVNQVLTLGCTLPLPEPHTDGSRIVLSRVFSYDPEQLKFSDVLKTAFMIGDQLIIEDDNIVVSGATVIVDLIGLSVSHASQITPTYLKKISTAIQDAYPFRQKGIHFINAPSLFDMFYKLFQNFLSSKLRKRLFIHDSLESLHKQIPKDLLPEEYGGNKIGKLEAHINNWKNVIVSKCDWYLDDTKYKAVDDGKHKNSTKFSNGSSIDGSFRKLEFD